MDSNGQVPKDAQVAPTEAQQRMDTMLTLLTIMRHRAAVSDGLEELSGELNRRSRRHDLSKLKPDEFEGYIQVNAAGRKYPYGSDEMKEAIRQSNCVPLHQSRNSHHPEYHETPWDMGFLDIIEMVIDWHAASVTYGQTSLSESVPGLLKKYRFTAGQEWLIRQVVNWVSDLEWSKRPQPTGELVKGDKE